MDAQPLPTSPHPERQAKNERVRKLAIHLTGISNSRLAVLLVPQPRDRRSRVRRRSCPPCLSGEGNAMNHPTEIHGVANIVPLIRSIRNMRVILDTDLARLYGVETRVLNQAVKRNQHRFPQDFVLMLAREEIREDITKCDILAKAQVLEAGACLHRTRCADGC